MLYENIRKATFLARPNRFIAHVVPEGAVSPQMSRAGTPSAQGEGYEICHVKNTGRCKELLIPGVTVYLQEFDSPSRKTKFDLIAVEKDPSALNADSPPTKGGKRLINMDAQAPNKVFGEWAASGAFIDGLTLLKPETTWGKSRFDFYFEAACGAASPTAPTGAQMDGPYRLRKGFVEVKGVTLEEDGAAYFPDAPTERGVKHIEELIACRSAGYEAYLCFIIQMGDVSSFSPNDRTHPAFGEALRRAAAAGVRLMAFDCAVTPDSLTLGRPVKMKW